MSELPPPIREEDFQNLEYDDPETIRERFESFFAEMAEFLNGLSCFQNIQQIRYERRSRASYPQAFRNEFNVIPRHWYTYNIGGRNEAQFNIAMFPKYFRVGLGFEFTGKRGGRPTEVGFAYYQFRSYVKRHSDVFEKFCRDNSIMIEWIPWGKDEQSFVYTEEVTAWLTRKPKKIPTWVFVGRLFCRKRDADTLRKPEDLALEMENVLDFLKLFWDRANQDL